MDPTSSRIAFGAAGGSPPPEIVSFTGTGSGAVYGQGAWITFQWETENADTVSLTDVGTLPTTTGSYTLGLPGYGHVNPNISPYNKTYTLTASSQTSSVTSSITFSCSVQCTGRQMPSGNCLGGGGFVLACI